MVGGMLVLFGLLLEKNADKEEFSNIDDFRLQKLKSKRGVNIVIAGIVVEIVVAGVFAAMDGWEMRQANFRESGIEARLQQRTITKEQHDAFIKYLAGAPRGLVMVVTIGVDNETKIYARKIRAMLDDAGYYWVDKSEDDVIFGFPLSTPDPHDVQLSVFTTGFYPAFVLNIKHAFDHIGIPL